MHHPGLDLPWSQVSVRRSAADSMGMIAARAVRTDSAVRPSARATSSKNRVRNAAGVAARAVTAVGRASTPVTSFSEFSPVSIDLLSEYTELAVDRLAEALA